MLMACDQNIYINVTCKKKGGGGGVSDYFIKLICMKIVR